LNENACSLEKQVADATCALEKSIAQLGTTTSTRLDTAVRDLTNIQESFNITQNSLHDCFNEIAAARGDLENSICESESRMKQDNRQGMMDTLEKIGLVDSQAGENFTELSRRIGALDLRMFGLQGGLGEGKRDIRSLREEFGAFTTKSVTSETLVNKRINEVSSQTECKQKEIEKHVANFKYLLTALTQGVVKFAQVVGVFPRDDGDKDSHDLLEDSAENLSP